MISKCVLSEFHLECCMERPETSHVPVKEAYDADSGYIAILLTTLLLTTLLTRQNDKSQCATPSVAGCSDGSGCYFMCA